MSLKKNILVVEDNNFLQEILKIYLEGAGFRVFQATSLVEGRDAFDKHGAELDGILMDRDLNQEYSDPLVRRIRETGFKKPIVAFCGDDKGQKALLAAGCSHRLDGKVLTEDFIVEFKKDIDSSIK